MQIKLCLLMNFTNTPNLTQHVVVKPFNQIGAN